MTIQGKTWWSASPRPASDVLAAGGGFAVLERLKLSTHTDQIPVFVLTGSGDDSNKEKALQMGAQQYIPKPYEFETLLSEIKKAVGEPA